MRASTHFFNAYGTRIFGYSALVIVVVLLFLVPFGYGVFERTISPKVPPQDLTNDFLLGDYYFNHGMYADGTYDLVKAREHYERALALQPKGDTAAWYQLGRIDFLEGKFDEALIKFDTQLEYFGDDQFPNVYYMRGLSYAYRAKSNGSRSDWNNAEQEFITYLSHDPDSPWGAVDLSWVYFMQGEYELMEPILVHAYEHNPRNPWVLNMYGLALLNGGRVEEAQSFFHKAIFEARQLNVDDWARSYPGNDPKIWDEGLAEFQKTLQKNLGVSTWATE